MYTPNKDPIQRLKDGVDAGYYAVDYVATDTIIPWAGKTCADCPFFEKSFVAHNLNGRCGIHNKTVQQDSETCAYFDPCNRDDGITVIEQRQIMTMPQWEKWFEENRIPIDIQAMV